MPKDFLTKGTIKSLKLDVKLKKSGGGTFKGHKLTITDEDGDKVLFKISAKNEAVAKFLKNMKEGDKVTVKEVKKGNFKNVVAVFPERKKGGQRAGSGKGEYNPLGQIQGMVLKAGLDIAIAKSKKVTVESILEGVEVVLEAKSKSDELVKAALTKSDDDDDTDEDEEDTDEDEEEDEDDDEEDEVY